MPSSFAYSHDYSPPAPVADIILRAQVELTTSALLDSGADGTMIPHRILADIGAKFVRTYKITGVVLNHLIITLDGITGLTEIS